MRTQRVAPKPVPLRLGGAAVLAALLAAITAPAAAGAPVRPREWPLDQAHFRAEQVWSLSRGGGVTVAVVDSGVDATHPDLADRVLTGTDEIGDPADGGRVDASADSHGTAIAGIIAGSGAAENGQGMAGLAPDARILPVRVAAGATAEPAALARGIVWAADHGAAVINVSLGTTVPNPVLRKAVEYAQEKDAVIVASAGNDGTDGNPKIYPASFPGVVSVSGTDENNAFWEKSESGPGITIGAPATGIYSTNDHGQYLVADGTSYAAAYVSATLALVRAQHPDYTGGQAVRRLIDSTRGHRDRPDPQTGYGLLDPLAALGPVTRAPAADNPLLHPPAPATAAASGPSTWVVIAATTAPALALAAAALVWWRRRTARDRTATGLPETRTTTTPARPIRPTRRKSGAK
ncbi:S8 family serine peptidase [Kitasatospora cineracea]